MTALPDADNVVRLVSGAKILPGGKVDGAAFRLRPEDSGLLSVNWLEFFSGSKSEQVALVTAAKRKLGMKIRKSARFFELNVNNSKTVLAANDYSISFDTDPIEPDDLSHAVIVGLTLEDEVAADMLATTCIGVHVPPSE